MYHFRFHIRRNAKIHSCYPGHQTQDPLVTSILERLNIYILPMVDRAGYVSNMNEDCSSSLNNNEVGSKFNLPKGQSLEADAVKTVFAYFDIHVGLSLEGSGMYLQVPSDAGEGQGPVQWLDTLTGAYSSTHPRLGGTWQCPSSANNSPGSVVSSSGDSTLLHFAQTELSTPVVEAHVSCCKKPHARNLPNLWKENLEPLLSFLDTAGQGVFGVVSDVDGNGLSDTKVVVEPLNRAPFKLAVSSQARYG